MKDANVMASFFDLTEDLIGADHVAFVEGKETQRPHSSELYSAGNWTVKSKEILSGPAEKTWQEKGFVSFQPNSDLVAEFLAVAETHLRDEKGPIVQIDQSLRDRLIHDLTKQHSHIGSFSIDVDAVVLQSDGKGNVSGITTNGLHIDEGESPLSFRIGLNLGPIPRRIIFSPHPLEKLLQSVGMKRATIQSGYRPLYQSLDGRNVDILAPKIEAGGGWCCTTAERLHDGRRAVELGQSTFLLLRALRNEE